MLQPHERKRLAEIRSRNEIDKPGGIDTAWLLALVENLDSENMRLSYDASNDPRTTGEWDAMERYIREMEDVMGRQRT